MNAKEYFAHKQEISKKRILKEVLLTAISLFIICSILSKLLFAYIEYRLQDTQVIVYQLEDRGKRE